MFNEEENARETIGRVCEALRDEVTSYEVVAVNDGSTDETAQILDELAKEFSEVIAAGYRHNRGRGAALRHGFAASRGRFVVSIDADLSYGPEHILSLYRALEGDPDVDIVLGSAYMPGGGVVDVPFRRLFISRLGNLVLSRLLPARIHTSTCVLRGYRRAALDSLLLCSDDKDIHLEILVEGALSGATGP